MRSAESRTNHRFYNIWYNMIDRCYREECTHFVNYGGRGIQVCDRWRDYSNFRLDLWDSYIKHCEDYGEKDTTLDRIDVDGNYSPENCRWATRKEQGRNKRNTLIAPNGETLKDYCEKNNIDYRAVHNRLRYGWTMEKALSEPIKHMPYKIILPNGETLVEYCKRNNLNHTTICGRISRGWTLEDAITKPIKHEHARKNKNNS